MTSESWSALIAVGINAFNSLAVYVLARRMGYNRAMGTVAAALLVLTPAHISYSLTAARPLYPVPFVLAWLLSIAEFERVRDGRILVASGAILGAGCYSYIAAILLMPLYLAVTLWCVARRGTTSRLLLAATAVAFLAVVSAGVWQIAERPEIYTEHVQRYRLYDGARLNPLQGAKDFLNYNNVQQRISLYWMFYDPAYLFITGGADARALAGGPLPLAFVVWVPLGIVRMVQRRGMVDVLVILGFATAALPAVLVDEPYVIHRELAIIPFAVLAAMTGVDVMNSRRKAILHLSNAGLFVLTVVQSVAFVVREVA